MQFHFFSKILKYWPKSGNFGKTSPGGGKKGIVNNLNEILIGKTPAVRKAIYFFSQSGFLLLFLFPEKGKKSNFNKISFKKKVNSFVVITFFLILWATLLINSSYEPHDGTYLLGSTFLLHQEGPKKPKRNFVTFVSGLKPTSWCLVRPWFRKGVKQTKNY